LYKFFFLNVFLQTIVILAANIQQYPTAQDRED
jgi:hypothetical protein